MHLAAQREVSIPPIGIGILLQPAHEMAFNNGGIVALNMEKSCLHQVDMSCLVFAPSIVQKPLVKWSLKPQVRDQQPFFGMFSNAFILQTFLKVSVTTLAFRLNEVSAQIKELKEEEEEEIELEHLFSPAQHEHELSIWRGFGKRMRFGLFRELSIYTIHRLYELVATAFVSEKTLKSLVKYAPRSAVRKAARYNNAIFVAEKVAVSTIKSQLLLWVSIFTFNEAYDIYETYYLRKKHQNGFQAHGTFIRRLRKNAIRCSLACVAAGVGAAIGSCFSPYRGTFVGLAVMPHLVFILI